MNGNDLVNSSKRAHEDSPNDGAFKRKKSIAGPENGHTRQSNGTSSKIDGTGAIEAPITMPVISENAQKWQATIDKVIKSVVAIRFCQVARFDSESAIVSEATGFVVDAKKGIILTNRHVVSPGPFVGHAVFDNHEETDVKPIYRDPVHDFGFLKFDPKSIKYMKINELKLRPDLAKVGCEIRVVGNDAGEKLSILSGFISRLDRNAPEYGFMTYNDFNTEYIQAAASASGGSSGSPVIDISGNTLALQAGGSTDSATDFFLPVHRVLRALKLIQAEKPITRGTIQVQWYLKPFDECRRLGLSEEAEEKARKLFPNIMSLLVAETILPEGPAYNKIKEGDILISINGEYISTFIKVDDILDSIIGNDVHILLQRNGEYIEVDCKVQDLHKITPNRYLQISGGSFNDLSYQIARSYVLPVKGVFVSLAGGTFNFGGSSKGWIIDSINNKTTQNLDEFIKVMETIPDREIVPIKFRHLNRIQSQKSGVVFIDRHWYGATLAIRNDETGIWDYKELAKSIPPNPSKTLSAKFIDVPNVKPGCAKLVRSFVMVNTRFPTALDSYPFSSCKGYGVVVDAKKGYVIVSRKYVPHDMCDVLVTIAESIIVPAKVVFMHPTYNYSVIQYDPKLVNADVISPKFSKTPINRGDSLNFIGYNYNFRVLASTTSVTDLLSINVPYSHACPRYRGLNLESVVIDSTTCGDCDSGVLADDDGTIRAIWLEYLGELGSDGDVSYRMGIDIVHMNNVIEALKNDKTPRVRIIDAEFYALTISSARLQGVSEKWIAELEKIGTDRFQFFCASRVTCAEDAIRVAESKDDEKKKNDEEELDKLKVGDIVLALNGTLVHRITQLHDFSFEEEKEVELTIVRNSKEITIKVKTTEVGSSDHYVAWSGANIQEPHHSVRQELKNLPSRVYVSHTSSGSPAQQYGIAPTNFITHVNEIATPTLKEFMEQIKKIPDNTYCKLRMCTFERIPFAISLKTNYHYFSTVEYKRNTEGNWDIASYDKDFKAKKDVVVQKTSY
ncbi:Nma111 protein [Saccharomycopsis crataegensis]|uniref:Pro-apoptotic serine protease NMA111 n=1 Tax=Saccharomycopsis crataegensis TaxID=43959 RepID=A0AAV5QTF4_9ASCO|nr:Nma111 protein [Saccharomycopsis crataegensis]